MSAIKVVQQKQYEADLVIGSAEERQNSKEAVLATKNGNHVWERSKEEFELRKRRSADSQHAKETDSSLSDIDERKLSEGISDEENTKPFANKKWRSRCGRKRKYFGHASERQGATRREHKRFRIIQEAFEDLRQVIPKAHLPKYGKLSKYATLKLAATYISLLSNELASSDKMDNIRQDLNAFEASGHGNQYQSDTSCSSASGISENELFKGDFTDILCAAEDGEGADFNDEIFRHILEEGDAGNKSIPL